MSVRRLRVLAIQRPLQMPPRRPHQHSTTAAARASILVHAHHLLLAGLVQELLEDSLLLGEQPNRYGRCPSRPEWRDPAGSWKRSSVTRELANIDDKNTFETHAIRVIVKIHLVSVCLLLVLRLCDPSSGLSGRLLVLNRTRTTLSGFVGRHDGSKTASALVELAG